MASSCKPASIDTLRLVLVTILTIASGNYQPPRAFKVTRLSSFTDVLESCRDLVAERR